ncbi:cytochrome-c peroxidase [Deinococcus pimensis]|uniref:cytochrome-c peroxidase n=1 Tax=Deinococcus pimensis TaxID=309888 RepID=UPI000480A590|nr:cytochrome c peroxidase [Deinococcus pimensis]
MSIRARHARPCRRPYAARLTLTLGGALLAGCATTPHEQTSSPAAAPLALSGEPLPLGAVPIPRIQNSTIKNQQAAVRLGKALFWDVQVGSDGKTACASCHAVAGADDRTFNIVNPGPNGIFEATSGPDQPFDFSLDDTPDADPFDHKRPAGDDILGSQGVVQRVFRAVGTDPTSDPVDVCDAPPTTRLGLFGTARQVTGRNSPTVIGAVHNRQQFWDGRAHDVFNGFNPFGVTANADLTSSGYDARRFRPDGNINNIDRSAKKFIMAGGSLASQAVGPINNDVEMACEGRRTNGRNGLAEKLLRRTALARQKVDPKDGVLGTLARSDRGLKVTYRQMIEDAFIGTVSADPLTYFTVVFGEAVDAYESTLVPTDTPFDRYLAGDLTAMTDQQKAGYMTFKGRGNCMSCHADSELTDASVRYAALHGLVNEDGGDQGFHRLGVTPAAVDPGRAGAPTGGQTFSMSKAPADVGAFKTPALRNVRLTAPYFHDGSAATLHDVIDFYERAGASSDPTIASQVKRVKLESADHDALEDFLANALTDCRVVRQSAPFDHPELNVPNGRALPAVGASGVATSC